MQKYRNQFILSIFVIITLYILYVFFSDSQSGENSATITETLASFNWSLLPLLVGTQIMMVFFRFITWQYYMGVVGTRDKMSLFDSFLILVSGFVLVISPGKAAEILKSVVIKAKTGVPFAKTVPVVFAERILDGLAVIVLMSVAILIAGDNLNLGTHNGVDYNALSRNITLFSLVAIIGGLIVVQIRPLATFCLNIIARLPLLKRIHQPLVTFYESSREIFELRHVIPLTLVGVGTYFSSALCFILVLHGFGLEITWQLILQATFIVGVTSAIGALSFVPNGAGITELSTTGMILALITPLHPAMTFVVASAASLLQGFFHKWLRVFFGLGLALIFRQRLFNEGVQQAIQETETLQSQSQPQTAH
jgi:glycosyltransferase 2 family protein